MQGSNARFVGIIVAAVEHYVSETRTQRWRDNGNERFRLCCAAAFYSDFLSTHVIHLHNHSLARMVARVRIDHRSADACRVGPFVDTRPS
jgi:hypothetical protein